MVDVIDADALLSFLTQISYLVLYS